MPLSLKETSDQMQRLTNTHLQDQRDKALLIESLTSELRTLRTELLPKDQKLLEQVILKAELETELSDIHVRADADMKKELQAAQAHTDELLQNHATTTANLLCQKEAQLAQIREKHLTLHTKLEQLKADHTATSTELEQVRKAQQVARHDHNTKLTALSQAHSDELANKNEKFNVLTVAKDTEILALKKHTKLATPDIEAKKAADAKQAAALADATA